MTGTGSLPTDDGLVQVLDRDGTLRADATVPAIPAERMVEIYEGMRAARHLDERATTLHRQGRIGTYPPLAGQEAAQVASTQAVADDDWIAYQYREHGAVGVRGLSKEYLLYWMGYERGNEALGDQHIFPLNISIASQIPHATGLAWASKIKGDSTAVVCHFGEGATSEGDFHEALNFAGVYDVPAVFFCNNNQYAISVGRERQTASATIAQKADAYGFRGVRVDGMDPLAVYEVTRRAVDRARDPDAEPPETGSAGRPTLVEAVMYRFGAHTTVDDPSGYREAAEVERWREYDPIPRYESFLRERGLLDDELVSSIEQRVEDEIATLIDGAEQVEPDPETMFDHVYAERTPRIRDQQAQLRELRERHGDDGLLRDE